MCVCVCVPNSKPWFPVFSIFQEPDNEAWSLCVCVCVCVCVWERERERDLRYFYGLISKCSWTRFAVLYNCTHIGNCTCLPPVVNASHISDPNPKQGWSRNRKAGQNNELSEHLVVANKELTPGPTTHSLFLTGLLEHLYNDMKTFACCDLWQKKEHRPIDVNIWSLI